MLCDNEYDKVTKHKSLGSSHKLFFVPQPFPHPPNRHPTPMHYSVARQCLLLYLIWSVSADVEVVNITQLAVLNEDREYTNDVVLIGVDDMTVDEVASTFPLGFVTGRITFGNVTIKSNALCSSTPNTQTVHMLGIYNPVTVKGTMTVSGCVLFTQPSIWGPSVVSGDDAGHIFLNGSVHEMEASSVVNLTVVVLPGAGLTPRDAGVLTDLVLYGTLNLEVSSVFSAVSVSTLTTGADAEIHCVTNELSEDLPLMSFDGDCVMPILTFLYVVGSVPQNRCKLKSFSTDFVVQDSKLYALPVTSNANTAFLPVLAVLLLATLVACLKYKTKWRQLLRSAVSTPPAEINLLWNDLWTSPANIAACALLVVEKLWFIAVTFLHPHAVFYSKADVYMVLTAQTIWSGYLFGVVSAAIAVWCFLWGRLRWSAEAELSIAVKESRESGSLSSMVLTMEGMNVWERRANVWLSCTFSAMFIPVLLVLLHPLQCGIGEDEVTGICAEVSGAYLVFGILLSTVVAVLVVESGSNAVAPLRHPPFLNVDVRTKRVFDAGRVTFTALQIAALMVSITSPAVGLTFLVVLEVVQTLWTLLVPPTVYANVNRLRMYVEAATLWSMYSACSYLNEDSGRHILCEYSQLVPPSWFTVLWLCGAVGWVALLAATFRFWKRHGSVANISSRVSGLRDVLTDNTLSDDLRSTSRREYSDFMISFTTPYLLCERDTILHCAPEKLAASLIELPSLHSEVHSNSNSNIATTNNVDEFKNLTLGRLLGRGNFGSVYVGILKTGALVAVKVVELNVNEHGEATGKADITKEVEFIRNMVHPNVISYKSCWIDPQQQKMHIVMEYAVGGSLTSLVKGCASRLSESVASKYIKQAVSGLAYLHSYGIIHRDIKGDNILLDAEGRVKLADFGCAKEVSKSTGVGTFVGTPYWMAPEVMKMKFQSTGYNRKADVWSIGCTTIEVLTRYAVCMVV